MPTIGFIGLGNMGLGLCLSLATSNTGMKVIGYDLGYSADMINTVTSGGIEWVLPSEMAQKADVLFTSLPGPREVEQVMTVLLPLMKGIWVDMTTTSKTAALKMYRLASDNNVQMVEAPVTGGSDGAWAGAGNFGCRGGKAVLLLGGPAHLMENHPIVGKALRSMGEVQRCGDKVGDGTAMKLITNGCEYVHAAVIGEALAVARESGLSVKLTLQALARSSGGSYCASHDGQAVRVKDFDPSFPTVLAVKDLKCMDDLAKTASVGTPVMRAARQQYDEALIKYGPDSPWLSLIRMSMSKTSMGEPKEEKAENLPGIDFDSLWKEKFGSLPKRRIVARL